MVCVLLVDDDDDLRDDLAGILTDSGYHVLAVADGNAGLAKLSECPDLLITDLVMAGMEGIETIREIRRRKHQMPIIAMSGNAIYLNNSTRLGADTALLKPFTKKQLLAAVEGVLAGALIQPQADRR